jgi:hypothetical protein
MRLDATTGVVSGGGNRMRKKISLSVGTAALAILLSSCFVLQGFVILDYSLSPGKATKVRFTLRPSNFDNLIGPPATGAQYEFVIVGVPDTGDLTAQKAKWGTNGKFGGPMTMAANGALIAAMGSQCSANGLNLQDMTNMTFKTYVTPSKIGDGNKFSKSSVVEVGIKAQSDASPGDNWQVVGIAGEWVDDGDDIPNGSDFFGCEGMGFGVVHIQAA